MEKHSENYEKGIIALYHYITIFVRERFYLKQKRTFII
jgi:hypothetical protein